jgi:hypothetical protein
MDGMLECCVRSSLQASMVSLGYSGCIDSDLEPGSYDESDAERYGPYSKGILFTVCNMYM